MVRPNFRDFRLYDFNCLGYLGLIAFLLLFFHRNVHLWPVYILVHVVLISAILIIVRLDKRYSGTKLFWLLRSFYPIGVMMFAGKGIFLGKNNNFQPAIFSLAVASL